MSIAHIALPTCPPCIVLDGVDLDSVYDRPAVVPAGHHDLLLSLRSGDPSAEVVQSPGRNVLRLLPLAAGGAVDVRLQGGIRCVAAEVKAPSQSVDGGTTSNCVMVLYSRALFS